MPKIQFIADDIIISSLFDLSFPMFAGLVFYNLSAKWASTTLTLIARVLAPAPVLFYRHGNIRRKSIREIMSPEEQNAVYS